MTPSRFNAAMLILATILSGGCATALYDTLLEGADRIIAIHTAKDKPRTLGSNSAQSVHETSSMNETNAGAATNSTTYVDEKAYRARTAGLDVRQSNSASIADSGKVRDGSLERDPKASIRIEPANKLLPANSSQGYGAQYTATQATGSAQNEHKANSQEALEAMETLMMARSQGENSNGSVASANSPVAENPSGPSPDTDTRAQLERELWAAYRAFDFENVKRIAPALARLPSATSRQAATAWFLAGAAAYLQGDVERARSLFRQAAQTDKLFPPDATVFPNHMLEFYKKSTATADSHSR